jgi:hypothetical protein
MSSTDTTGTTSSSSHHEFNPRQHLEQMMRTTKRDLSLPSTRELILEKFKEELFAGVTTKPQSQRWHLETIISDWSDHAYTSLLKVIWGSKSSASETTTKKAKVYEERLAEGRKSISVIWFNFIMPNGKPLSECTGADLRNMRTLLDRNLRKLIRRVKPRQLVRSLFNKDTLQEFCQ